MKAKFKIRLHYKDDTVQGLSSSKSVATENQTEFEETGKITTASVDIAILDTAYRPEESFVNFSNLKIRCKMFYKDGLLREYITVHSIVRDILDLFFKYFDFPLKKFDIVIGPDFETKGYYGFILMSDLDANEIALKSITFNNYKLFSQICRAISIQWIGHILTMSLWYENFLIRGFNDMLSVLCVNEVGPAVHDHLRTTESI
ncbi:hypothetical protein V9T40_005463 [Parthenolecanium corni]|uniref:Uncharacterized protein n=1 Tax=Parthenolecanium corni TaxID=536013 RepID=A0AAN9Y3C2_9HEMI